MLQEKNKIRQLVLFSIWINSALRISDLLSLKVKHVFSSTWEVRENFELKEAKTWKSHKVSIPKKTRQALELYKITYPTIVSNSENYIFFRAKSNTKWQNSISRIQWWKYIWQWCSIVWLKGNYWWHTLRKTRGYQARKKWVSLNLIQHKLNHSSQSVTLRYLWITQEEVDDAVNNLDL